jgi:hypothetical protein
LLRKWVMPLGYFSPSHDWVLFGFALGSI